MTTISASCRASLRSPNRRADWSAGSGRRACASAAYWERRAAIKTLRELDDRDLRDIGLVRSQIEARGQAGRASKARTRWRKLRSTRSMRMSLSRDSSSVPHHQHRAFGVAHDVAGIGAEEIGAHRRPVRRHHDQVGLDRAASSRIS